MRWRRPAILFAIHSIWLRDVRRYLRDRWRLLTSLFQPIVYLFVFGTGLSASLRASGARLGGSNGIDYEPFLFPGVIGMAILFTAALSSMTIVWDRETGFHKTTLVTPVNGIAMPISKVLSGATLALIQGLILLPLAWLVGLPLTPVVILQVLVAMLALAVALSALGVAIASRIRSLGRFQTLMNLLILPLFFLSGAIFPLASPPPWLVLLSTLDPAAYGVDAIRRTLMAAGGVPTATLDHVGPSLLGHTLSVPVDETILLGFAAVMLVLAIPGLRLRD
jgi:ABC-2 type transport system permease protein